jgi:hypothetical protein
MRGKHYRTGERKASNPAHSPRNPSVVLTAHRGINADLLPHILKLYVPNGSLVADVTWGTESGKQCFSHVELIQLLKMFGFEVIDLFVMVQSTIPITGRGPQKSARKNHSYALVARFRR